MKAYCEQIIEDSEAQYLKYLIMKTGSDTQKDRKISDLSKSRFCTLLRKYNNHTQSSWGSAELEHRCCQRAPVVLL